MYFDHKTIPIHEDNFDFTELVANNMLKFIEPKNVLETYNQTKEFQDFILDHIYERSRNMVKTITETMEPGWQKETRKVGALLPPWWVDLLALH